MGGKHTLWSWITVLGPAKRVTVKVQQCVLLFDTKPGLRCLRLFHNLGTRHSLVRFWKKENTKKQMSPTLNMFSQSRTVNLLTPRCYENCQPRAEVGLVVIIHGLTDLAVCGTQSYTGHYLAQRNEKVRLETKHKVLFPPINLNATKFTKPRH